MFKFNKSHFKSQAHQFQLLRWSFSTSFLRFSVLCCTRWFYLLIQCWQEPWWLLVLGDKDHLTYLGARNQRDGDSSKEILSAPAMGLNVLNEFRGCLSQFAIYACATCAPRKTNKQRIAAFKKECYCRVLRTLWVRRCTNEDIGKDMNIISDWLLQYFRRKKRFFQSCNRAVCVPRKGRIVWPTIQWKEIVKELFFGCMKRWTRMAQNRPVTQAAVWEATV